MKKLLTLGFIHFCLISFAQTSDSLATIIFYRESAKRAAFRVLTLRDSVNVLTHLYNNSAFEYHCRPGVYRFTINKFFSDANVTMEVEAGKVYNCKGSVYSSSFAEAMLTAVFPSKPYHLNYYVGRVDSVRGKQFFNDNAYLDLNQPLRRNKNRIGFGAEAGGGVYSKSVGKTPDGEDVSISFGAGVGLSGYYGRELSKSIDLEVRYTYLSNTILVSNEKIVSSTLPSSMNDAKVEFNHHVISLTPSWIIPINGGYTERLKLGAGLDTYLYNSLVISNPRVYGVVKDTWKYENTLGYHIQALVEINPNPHLLFCFGLRYYSVKYHITPGELMASLDHFYSEPNGSGFCVQMGASYNFNVR